MFTSRPILMLTATAFALQLLAVSSPTLASDSSKNTTGLPTYPRVDGGMMDPVPRDTFGRKCTHFATDTPDPLQIVENWYRKALAGATESDVNKDSIYGDYFKLTGIKLSRGDDFLTVYRTENGKSTSIELFKCAAPAK